MSKRVKHGIGWALDLKKALRFGIVDVGTNAVRFELYELSAGIPRRTYQRREIFRLGDTLEIDNRINPAPIPALLEAFAEFSELARKSKVCSIKAVGTSVFRRAEDAQQLRSKIFDSSGIDIEVISGEREASLIAAGIHGFEPDLCPTCLFVDIGGGSSEVSATNDAEIVLSKSLPLGAITAQKQFLKSAPPSQDSILELRQHIRDLLAVIPASTLPESINTAVCSSGTARALALISDSSSFEISWLDSFIDQVKLMKIDEILAVAGIKERRSDIILAGAIMLQEILNHASVSNIRISEFSLRHGLLLEAIAEQQYSE